MSINPAAIIGTKAIAKRVIWRDAQGCRLPFAAEYNMAKPMPAIAAISSTKPHWIPRTLSERESSGRPKSEEKLAIGYNRRGVIAASDGTDAGGSGEWPSDTEAGSGTRRAGSRRCASTRTSRQIGAAAADPPPP